MTPLPDATPPLSDQTDTPAQVTPPVPGLLPRTMRAVVQDEYGGPEVLLLAERPVPAPGDHDVLVRVHAAGVDRGTHHLMTGTPRLVRLGFGLRRPRLPVPGRDVAGTVAAVGGAVTRFAVGDEVLGVAPGSFAEFAVTSEDKLSLKPSRLSFAQAAALAISGTTAWQALVDAGRLQAGQSVLVLGASGGVGSFAVQIATTLGCEVTGVCSAQKADLVRSLGATDVLDHARDDFADGTRRWDLVLDLGGNPSLRHLRRAAAPRGTIVIGGGGGGPVLGGVDRQLRAVLLSPFVRQRLTTLLASERAEALAPLLELVADGRVTPAVERTWPLEQAADALRHLGSGRARGKLVVTTGA